MSRLLLHLDTLLSRAGEIKQPKRRAALQDNAELARISKKLVQLKDDVPAPADPDVRSALARVLRERGANAEAIGEYRVALRLRPGDIGILTGGGDCPGLNAVIRAAIRHGRSHDGAHALRAGDERHTSSQLHE